LVVGVAHEVGVEVSDDVDEAFLLSCFSRKWRDATAELYYNSAGVSPMRKPRKNYTPSEKVAILRRHLLDRVPVSDLCDGHQLSPTLFYLWQKQFFENGAAAFERKNTPAETTHLRTIAALREKLQRKNEVVAELMEEHIQLKKELGEL
jgi:transposase-like protein